MSFHRADDELRRAREREWAQQKRVRDGRARSVLDRIAASRLALAEVEGIGYGLLALTHDSYPGDRYNAETAVTAAEAGPGAGTLRVTGRGTATTTDTDTDTDPRTDTDTDTDPRTRAVRQPGPSSRPSQVAAP